MESFIRIRYNCHWLKRKPLRDSMESNLRVGWIAAAVASAETGPLWGGGWPGHVIAIRPFIGPARLASTAASANGLQRASVAESTLEFCNAAIFLIRSVASARHSVQLLSSGDECDTRRNPQESSNTLKYLQKSSQKSSKNLPKVFKNPRNS